LNGDECKNKASRTKHSLWIEEAQFVFDDPLGRLFRDNSSTDNWHILIGSIGHSKLLVVVHCYRASESIVRIISARKATKQERQIYEKRV
jgi:uncharacterized DUF497 family protein